jgi:PIN domain nuclease of toxin-antitoxin system
LRILLDTHALLWWLAGDPRIERKAQDLIADPANDILVSTASLWEVVVKVRVGKLEADISDIVAAINAQGFEMLDIRPEHLKELVRLPMHHRDPFDHLLKDSPSCRRISTFRLTRWPTSPAPIAVPDSKHAHTGKISGAPGWMSS